jgi:hypothetical protein
VSVAGTGGQPYQAGHIQAPGNTFNGYQETIPFWVPEGKLLVVEHISGRINLPTGQKVKTLGLQTLVGGVTAFHWIHPVSLGKGNFHFSEELTVYAEGGGNNAVLVAVRSHGSPTAHWYFSVSGFLIDAP